MKLLFIENRHSTQIYEKVAPHLIEDGHEVHFMVQNPAFAPRVGHVHVLPFPRKAKRGGTPATEISCFPTEDKLDSDRAVRYFGVRPFHYGHYRRQIQQLIDRIAPDVIFGEPTQFHELMALAHARRRGIEFLYPSPTRYPPGRMTFHRYDTMDTLGGCNEELPAERAMALREAIAQRRTLPSSVETAKISIAKQRSRKLLDKIRVTTGWVKGERYVTPSPWKKVRLEYKQRAMVRHWESFALACPDELTAAPCPWVLYAMQMQPESNIEVWGHPWSDQIAIIQAAADALGAIGAKLVVKPNPRSKYELSLALCKLVSTHPHIVALSHKVKMADIFASATALLSVTGTVVMESVMAGKPVGVLGQHNMAHYPGVASIRRPEDIVEVVRQVQAGTYQVATADQAEQLLTKLHAASYPGVIFDPLHQPQLASPENIHQIRDAFRALLRYMTKCKTQKRMSA